MSFPRRTIALQISHARQQGVILFVALIVLVAMSLAGVALVRSVDTNVLIAGNLAFRQASTLAAERGVESARQFLLDQTGTPNLQNDVSASGYFASVANSFDYRSFDWAANAYAMPDSLPGYKISVVVHRMCEAPGPETGVNCVRAGASGTASSSLNSIDYSRYPLSIGAQVPAYRVTSRAEGPRNTVSMIQVVIFP